jgi:hypothetical protein
VTGFSRVTLVSLRRHGSIQATAIELNWNQPHWLRIVPEHPEAEAATQLPYLAPSDRAGDRPGSDLTTSRLAAQKQERDREGREEPNLWWPVRTAAPPPRAAPRRSKRRICRLPPFFHPPPPSTDTRSVPGSRRSPPRPLRAEQWRRRLVRARGRLGRGGLVAEGGDLMRWGARLKACPAACCVRVPCFFTAAAARHSAPPLPMCFPLFAPGVTATEQT